MASTKYLTRREVAEAYPLQVSTLAYLASNGRGPRYRIIVALAVWIALAAPVSAQTSCSSALEAAALEYGVPADLLTAIAEVRQERVPASPYAVNVGGWRKVFDTFAAAKRGALRLHSVGDMRLGCALMSWSGNMEYFETFERMFDARATSDYFARYMLKQYEEKGSWSKAVAAAHTLPLWKTGRNGSIVCAVARRMAVRQKKDSPDCE